MRFAIERHLNPRLRLLPLLDETGERAWAEVRVAGAGHEHVSDALQARLAAMPLPGDAVPLIYGSELAWRLAERHLEPARLAALTALPNPASTDAPRSREALAELLHARGIRRSLAELATWGLALVPDGQGQSRLGGHLELEGEWPHNDGRALTHLASIALAELPDFEDRNLLPHDGTIVFLADFGDEHGGWDVASAAGPEVRIIHVPAGAGQPVAPPDERRGEREVPVTLNERRIRFSPVLTLPFPDDLDEDDEDALLALQEESVSPDHLLLGHPVYIQDNPPDNGQISLLQLNWDEPLNFMCGDGGQITFFGSPADIRAGRWDQLHAQLDSS
jgi:uncharacterized protein YwqG